MKNIFYIVISVVFFASCDDDSLVASGRSATETRALESFNKLNINAARDIKVVYSDQTGITLTGSDNLLSHLRSSVRNEQLDLYYDQDQINHDDLEITITLPYFKELRINGRRQLTTYGSFDYTDNINITSNGENEMESVDDFAAGNLNISLTGAGKADFRRLSGSNAKASIIGGGTIYLKAEQSLTAQIHGSGQIYYAGHPQITSDITGTGSIWSL
ncbi:GIN domain-containing protein [Flavobacterium olei]|uniref:GIN domain-containing protein n=1 Tax=Flavobacterium olei TaxID=1886782 RepID=UPI00321BD71C